MKSDQSDLEDHEEINKHVAGDEKGLAEITFQMEEHMCKDPVTGVGIIHSQNKHEAGIQKVKGNMVDLGQGGDVKRYEECGLSPKMGKKLISRSCHCYWDMGRCFPRRPSKTSVLSE